MNLLILSKYKHLGRYREITQILSKHGFGYLLEAIPANLHWFNLWQKKRSVEPARITAERLRQVLEELGPAFIKLGQLLSTRPDLLAPVYLEQLEQLQENVSPEPFTVIKRTIETEFKKPLDHIFPTIDPCPLATASIGQVHRGRLTNGTEIVVKVQRTGIVERVKVDLEILADVAEFLEARLDWARRQRLRSLVAEFSETLRDELDYTTEAHNAQRLRANLRAFQNIIIPRIYWEYTSAKVLVLQYHAGDKIPVFSSPATPTRAKLARQLVAAVFQQIIADGFFHADLHPGNIRLNANGQLVLLDFGMMGRIDTQVQEQLALLLIQVISKDLDGLTDTLIHLDTLSGDTDRNGFRREIFFLLDKHLHHSLKQLSLGRILQDLIRIVLKYQIVLPREFISVFRTLILLEGVLERLDPSLNWMELAAPLAQKILQEHWKPEYILKKNGKYLQHVSGNLLRLPESFNQTLQKAAAGKLRVTLEHQNFDQFILKINLIGNRLAFSLIIAAIIVGTSLIAQRTDFSFLWGLPISELGFIIALLMGIWLLISIIRSGKI